MKITEVLVISIQLQLLVLQHCVRSKATSVDNKLFMRSTSYRLRGYRWIINWYLLLLIFIGCFFVLFRLLPFLLWLCLWRAVFKNHRFQLKISQLKDQVLEIVTIMLLILHYSALCRFYLKGWEWPTLRIMPYLFFWITKGSIFDLSNDISFVLWGGLHVTKLKFINLGWWYSRNCSSK